MTHHGGVPVVPPHCPTRHLNLILRCFALEGLQSAGRLGFPLLRNGGLSPCTSLRLALWSRAGGKPAAGPQLLSVKAQLDWGHSGSERLLLGAKARVAKPLSQQTGSVFTQEGPSLLAAPAGLRCGFISEHSSSGGFSSLRPPLSFCVSISTAANTYHASLTEM